jgi:tetratricopeptide (TPR) repeat protein
MPAHSRPAQMIAGIAAFGVLAFAVLSGQPQAKVPLMPATIVATLGSGPALPDDLRSAILMQRANPDDLAKAISTATLMIGEGRDKGDSRLVGAALGIVQPFVAQSVPDAQFVAAQARQYQHDFTGALALLDRVLAARPTDVNALLNRATIHTVVGAYAPALADCANLAEIRSDVGFLCQATVLVLTENAPQIAERLMAILEKDGLLDENLVPWATSLLGEIALMQGDAVTAERHLRAVLARDARAQREQLMLADLLLSQDRASEVTSLLQAAPDTDGTLIRRVLAARKQGQDVPDVVAMLESRAQRSIDLGLVAHAREEAMYFLLIADAPDQALERAIKNWGQQHEFEDARLLILSADAAGKPEAATDVFAWMRATGVAIPALPIPASMVEIAKGLKP